MACKRPFSLLSLPTTLRTSTTTTSTTQCRHLHRLNAPSPRIPPPTPFVPDASTFLTLIGRGMSAHAGKIPSWEALFTLSSQQLKEAGVEPPRARKYLLWWRDRFRNGITGIGGDLQHVKDGVAELRIMEMKKGDQESEATLTGDAGAKKVVVNTPHTILGEGGEVVKGGVLASLAPPPQVDPAKAVQIRGVRVVQATKIGGTGVEPVKKHQGVARLKVRDGLWEQRRGHKVDGGERRKAEVRAKRRAAERKAR